MKPLKLLKLWFQIGFKALRSYGEFCCAKKKRVVGALGSGTGFEGSMLNQDIFHEHILH